ncbi:hypothetical protein BDM02DRAFT_3108167 [Thelephora ganbajun]|uniref:Uncharacterized protein n=1 Tax=Thelephora ganbajun TaxID=370292 RepID=A0ACB6ZUE4_THEGA|nr:hypothetical protein BDM02DRAFT_3108167 [Thelephora ganbajun]
MRVSTDLEHHLRHVVKRMASSGSTVYWTVIIFAHFVTRAYLQGVTFGENYAHGLTSLYLDAADAPHEWLVICNHALQICGGIPGHGETACQVMSTELSFEYQPRFSGFQPISLQQNFTVPFNGGEKVLSGKCITAMQYFHDAFRDALAEDVATISFQLWGSGDIRPFSNT